MTEAAPAHCPVCGRRLAGDAPLGLCTACLLAAGLAEDKEEADSLEASPVAHPEGDQRPGPGGSSLSVRCPHCGHLIQLASGASLSSVHCDSCGTNFSVVDETAASQAAADLGQIGQFQILEKLGTGAFGTVWKARDTRLDRWVSIKIPRHRRLDPAEAEKFLREARAAAQLRHPNIVSVHEVGREEDLIYIVCDFVEGVSLADWLTGHRLSPREAARLGAKLARALEHAHEAGVIHRDVKPQNILIDSAGEPHLTDFGLARREAGEVTLTLDGQLLGTPAYMSPEQARGEAHAADRRTDIYSLGAVLFQVLTGELPFRGNARMMVQQVIQDDAPSPRKLNAHVPRDLETITLKCLEKDPGRRYATAGDLADDLDRFANGEPIRARSVGPAGKAWRWCRRKPTLATMAATLVVVLALGLFGVLTQWHRAERSATAERTQRHQAEQALHRLELQRAQDLFANHNAAAGLASLASLVRQDPNNRAIANRILAELTHRHWPLPALDPLAHPDEVHRAEFSPDGARILTACMDNAVRLWDAASGRLLAPPLQHDPEAVGRAGRHEFQGNLKPIVAQFSPDRHRLATGSVDNTARVWDTQTGQPLTAPLVHPDWVTALQFSPDGNLLATASRDGAARLWRAQTGELLGQPLRHARCVNFVAFNPDGTWLLTGSDDATAQVWEVETGMRAGKPMRHGGIVKTGRFSPDGRRVATASQDRTARLWDAATGEPLSPPLHHENQVVALAFSPNGGLLATASFDTTVRLWDGRSGAPQGRPLEHGGTVRSLQFSPEGEWLLSGSEDKTVRLWDVRTCRLAAEPMRHQGAVWSARFNPDGQRVITASSDRTAQVWDVRPGAALARHLRVTNQAHWVRWSPDGQWVLLGAYSPVVFESATGQARKHALRAYARPTSANFSPDGHRVVLCFGREHAQVWDLAAVECVRQFYERTGIHSACFSPDGRTILTAPGDGTVALWDAASFQWIRSLSHQPVITVSRAEFSPDGKQLLTEAGGTICSWDPADGRPKNQWRAHLEPVTAARFGPDGRRVVTASKDGTARVWDAVSGAPVTAPLRHHGEVNQASFSPDGARVITASKDNTARLWDARSGAAIGEPLRHDAAVLWAGFSPDGDRAVTTSEDGTARLWNGRTGQILASPFEHPFFVNHAEFSPDGTQLATACQAPGGWIWDVPTVGATVPTWLPELAEAVAGQRIPPDGTTDLVPASEFLDLSRALAGKPRDEPCARWLEWFLADRSTRSVGPYVPLNVQEAVAAQAHQFRIGSSASYPHLSRLIALHPTNACLWARASRVALVEYRSRSDPALLERAGWLSRRALELAPAEAAAWWAHADWLAAAGDSAGALRAMETGAQVEPASAQFWLAFAAMLESAGRDQESLQAYTDALESNRLSPRLEEMERRRALLGRARVHRRQGEQAEALRDHRQAFGIEVPPRDPQTPAESLDLSAFYNANLDTDWRGMRFPRHNLSTLPRGGQTLGGIEFDLRGAIQLNWGSSSGGLQYPGSVPDIPVARRCRRIHFLHAALAINTPGERPRAYTMQLEDGQSFELPILMGVNVSRWDSHPTWDSPELIVAWEGTSPAGIPIRLFRATWTNPHPEVVVRAIDFKTPRPGDGPILFAITIE